MSHYIVLRPCKELEGKVPEQYDGYWYDFNDIPLRYNSSSQDWATASPNGLYEYREDGEAAEVWIIEPIRKEINEN